MKKIAVMIAVLGCSVMTFAFVPQAKKPWTVPAAASSKANPQKGATSVSNGKALYAKNCQSCHGKSGVGDGPKAAQLKTEPGDFTKAAFQAQTDGTLFYKISEGRDDMPSFKKKMPDAGDTWDVVNYVRTLKK